VRSAFETILVSYATVLGRLVEEAFVKAYFLSPDFGELLKSFLDKPPKRERSWWWIQRPQ
jgi:hypothetical protein